MISFLICRASKLSFEPRLHFQKITDFSRNGEVFFMNCIYSGPEIAILRIPFHLRKIP